MKVKRYEYMMASSTEMFTFTLCDTWTTFTVPPKQLLIPVQMVQIVIKRLVNILIRMTFKIHTSSKLALSPPKCRDVLGKRVGYTTHVYSINGRVAHEPKENKTKARNSGSPGFVFAEKLKPFNLFLIQ